MITEQISLCMIIYSFVDGDSFSGESMSVVTDKRLSEVQTELNIIQVCFLQL